MKGDGWRVALVALVVRLALVAWAGWRFPPVADGFYYQRLAERLASGGGYTWLWDDGAVTYAAHYPVGYPAAIAPLYALFGPAPVAAMIFNAYVGAIAAFAIHRVLARFRQRGVALAGGLAVALHPALVGYTPALMTEGIAAVLLACALWATDGARSSKRRLVAAGLLLGIATLVRPQFLLLAPVFGWLGGTPRWKVRGALLVTALALAVCLPWTIRNCSRMGRCALVSVNGGWNLLIGTQPEGGGGWAPLQTPPACREVFDEAEKDRCFEDAAWERIRERPLAWLRLADDKLGVTFDYCGAPGWYLHESNAQAFPHGAKIALGAVETIYERLALVLALFACWPRARRRLRMGVILAGTALAMTRHAWLAHLALLVALYARSWRGSTLYSAAFFGIGSVALVHVVFFGAGRYQLMVLPLMTALAALGGARLIRAIVKERRASRA
jgi:hypothetical protein